MTTLTLTEAEYAAALSAFPHSLLRLGLPSARKSKTALSEEVLPHCVRRQVYKETEAESPHNMLPVGFMTLFVQPLHPRWEQCKTDA